MTVRRHLNSQQVAPPANTSKAVRMRKPSIPFLLAGVLCVSGWCVTAAAQDTNTSGGQGVSPEPSVAEAARKTRADKKTEPQSAKHVWTDDNIPKTPRDVPTPASVEGGAAPDKGAAGTPADAGLDDKAKAELETKWRERFAAAHKKLADDEKEADLLQREYNLKRQQYYSDPNTALREQYQYPSGRGGELNDTAKKIEEKKAQIEADKQAISDLEDQLRKDGLPSGWSRP